MVTANANEDRTRPAQLEYILRNATEHPVSLRNVSGEVITIRAATSTSIALKQLSRRITIICTETARHISIDFPLVKPRSKKIADLASGTPSFPFAVYTFRVSTTVRISGDERHSATQGSHSHSTRRWVLSDLQSSSCQEGTCPPFSETSTMTSFFHLYSFQVCIFTTHFLSIRLNPNNRRIHVQGRTIV